jgi:hypothetical protein
MIGGIANDIMISKIRRLHVAIAQAPRARLSQIKFIDQTFTDQIDRSWEIFECGRVNYGILLAPMVAEITWQGIVRLLFNLFDEIAMPARTYTPICGRSRDTARAVPSSDRVRAVSVESGEFAEAAISRILHHALFMRAALEISGGICGTQPNTPPLNRAPCPKKLPLRATLTWRSTGQNWMYYEHIAHVRKSCGP